MQLYRSLLLTALAGACVRAQNFTGSFASSVDVKELSNWAPCAQECYPLGFGPPAGCGGLSNTSCICSDIAFDIAIAPCIVATCSLTERNMNEALATILCGEPPSEGFPTIAPINDAVSASVVAAASATASSLGDPNQLTSFPMCAQMCYNQSVAAAPLFEYGCDIAEPGCVCEPPFRARAAACEEITCDLRELVEIQVLSQPVCGPYYEKNSTLGSAVSSAIASATSAAFAATESKIPTNPAEYPPCAEACFDKYIPASGCGSLNNRACICGSASLTSNVARCYKYETNCSKTDLDNIFALVDEFCSKVGGTVLDSNTSTLSGIGSNSNTTTSNTSTTSTSPTSTSIPSPYTGQAPTNIAGGFALSMMVAVGLLGVVVLGL